ncbi:hypothetical protein ACOME3_004328 [Neoechinorhynchus agilis]
MGGLLCSQYAHLNFNKNVHIPLVLTLSTPHLAPVVNTDLYMNEFYRHHQDGRLKSNNKSDRSTLFVSIFGGMNDVLVPGHVCQLKLLNSSSLLTMSVSTTSIPGVWMTLDHICMVWCNEFIVRIVRMLYEFYDKLAVTRHPSNADAQIYQSIATKYLVNSGFGERQLHPDYRTKRPTILNSSATV